MDLESSKGSPPPGTRGLPDAIRWLLLLALTVSFSAVLMPIFPAHRNMSALVSDVSSGRTNTVYYADDSMSEYTLTWFSGGMAKSTTIDLPFAQAGNSDDISVEVAVRARYPGLGRAVSFRDAFTFLSMGGIEVLIPLAYPFAAPWPWVHVLAVAAGCAILGSMALGMLRRRPNSGAWIFWSLVTGAGFWAYLWYEPYPLVRFRRGPDNVPPLAEREAPGIRYPLARALIFWVVLAAYAFLYVQGLSWQ